MDKKMISYKKWFEPSCLAPRAAIRMTARTGNEGEWPVHKKDGDQKGPPSGAADSISLYPFSFKVPFDTDEEGNRIPIMAKCDVTLTEDDWGEAKIDGVTVVDMTKTTNEKDAGPEGGHTAWTMSGNCKVESGEHELVVTNENIEYSNPDANVAVCRYTLDVYPIEPGGEKTPEKCPCEGDACNDDGGSPSGPYSRSSRTGDGLGSFSSAGCSVQATTTETFMYWSCNFGSFRGLSGIRAGKVELRSTQTTEGMGSPAALTYHHPLGDMNVAGTEMPFSWGYDAVTGLPGTVGYPNGISKLLSYEQTRNLITGIRYVREEEVMEGTSYAYDALKRPVQRTLNQGAATRDDSFSYNDRNELIGAALGTAPYAYGYDNIGNRKTARELAEELAYEANSVNQYTSIARSTLNTSLSTLEQPFVPHYDASGNQTLVKTSTGIWTVVYNAENRPASFTSQDGTTIIECSYDYQGRRCMKKVTRGGTIVSHARYLYRGYLQIAELDMLEATPIITERYVWDPSEPAATRALLWEHRKTGGTFESCFMVHDLAKNVTAVFDSAGGRKASYDYTPYGMLISATGELAVENKFRFSSEYADDELALVYYNYRYYNPADGRWISRDPVAEQGWWNLYEACFNNTITYQDSMGRKVIIISSLPEWDVINFEIYNEQIQQIKNILIEWEKRGDLSRISIKNINKFLGKWTVTVDGEDYKGSAEDLHSKIKREGESSYKNYVTKKRLLLLLRKHLQN